MDKCRARKTESSGSNSRPATVRQVLSERVEPISGVAAISIDTVPETSTESDCENPLDFLLSDSDTEVKTIREYLIGVANRNVHLSSYKVSQLTGLLTQLPTSPLLGESY